MISDHAWCEWVNVSSGTGSPGLSRTKSGAINTHTHNRFTAGLEYVRVHPGQQYQKGKTKKVKTNLDLLEQEIVSSSGICWAICKSAPQPR